MAQTATPYPLNPTNANLKEKEVLRDLLDALSNTQVGVIGHSWSGNIVLHETKDRSNVQVTLINPAQLPFGGVVNQFINDVRGARTSVTIIAGTNDPVSKLGIGQHSADAEVCGGKCQDLRAADLSNPLVNQVSVQNAGHGMRSMIENGAQFMIPQ
jgi:expansin (peptidoglycan-binding protein)